MWGCPPHGGQGVLFEVDRVSPYKGTEVSPYRMHTKEGNKIKENLNTATPVDKHGDNDKGVVARRAEASADMEAGIDRLASKMTVRHITSEGA